MIVIINLFDVNKNETTEMQQVSATEFVDDDFLNAINFYMTTPIIHGEEKFEFGEKYLNYKTGEEVLMLMFFNEQKKLVKMAKTKKANIEDELHKDIHIMDDPLG